MGSLSRPTTALVVYTAQYYLNFAGTTSPGGGEIALSINGTIQDPGIFHVGVSDQPLTDTSDSAYYNDSPMGFVTFGTGVNTLKLVAKTGITYLGFNATNVFYILLGK